MGRDGRAVAVISVMLAVCAVVASGSPSGVLFLCVFAGAAVCLFRER
jgi:hypothetical protein